MKLWRFARRSYIFCLKPCWGYRLSAIRLHETPILYKVDTNSCESLGSKLKLFEKMMKIVGQNKKAKKDYQVLQVFEAGLSFRYKAELR